MPVGILARKLTTKRKRSSKSRKTRTTATSAKWKVCIPAQRTSCHSLSTSMTNRFPNFCRTMCRPRKVLVVPNKNHSPLVKTSTNPHRKVLELAFEGKETISGYKALEEELTTAYELAGTKLNHNKIVETIKFLTNKRMVVQESRGIYRFMPDYHY